MNRRTYLRAVVSGVALGGGGRSIGNSNAIVKTTTARRTSGWTQQARVIPTDPDDLDAFGGSVALDGDTALIGAAGDENNSAGFLESGGSTYVFTSGDGNDGDPSLAQYANEKGIIDTDGLRTAIDDWRSGDIDTDLLRDVIDAWRSGKAVD